MLYSSAITVFVFYMVWLDSVECIDIPIPVLVTLIGKTAATDIGAVSYAAITKNLFPERNSNKTMAE